MVLRGEWSSRQELGLSDRPPSFTFNGENECQDIERLSGVKASMETYLSRNSSFKIALIKLNTSQKLIAHS